MRAALLFGGVLAVLLIGCASEKKIEQEVRGRKSAYAVDARDLCEQYTENQIKADAKYGGEVISVRGNVSDVSQDVRGRTFLMLSANNIGSGVQCFFDGEKAQKLMKMKGRHVTVKGRCDGMDQSVVLRGCVLR